MKKTGKLTARELRVRFKELEPVKLVSGSERLLAIWNQLDDTRPRTDGFPLAITYQEIKAYCELTDQKLNTFEIQVLRAVDDAFLDESYKIKRERQE